MPVQSSAAPRGSADEPTATGPIRRRALIGGAAFLGASLVPATTASATGPDHGREDGQHVAALHRRWIFEWDKAPEDPPFSFDETFADRYDFVSDDVVLYDDLAPDQQTATSATRYGDLFEPLFNALSRAEHAIEAEPTAVVSGRLAASHMVFVARFTAPDGTVSGIRTHSSLVFRKSGQRDRRGWRIIREHNSSVALTAEEVDALLAALPTS